MSITPERIAEIKARSTKASKAVADMCDGGKWRMSVPVNHNRDHDVIIADSLRDVPDLLGELSAATKRAEAAEGALVELVAAASLAKKHLQTVLVEPGRTVFWALVDPIAKTEKLLVAAARAQQGKGEADGK